MVANSTKHEIQAIDKRLGTLTKDLREGGDFDKFFAYIFMGPMLLVFLFLSFSFAVTALKLIWKRLITKEDMLSDEQITKLDDNAASDIRLG